MMPVLWCPATVSLVAVKWVVDADDDELLLAVATFDGNGLDAFSCAAVKALPAAPLAGVMVAQTE